MKNQPSLLRFKPLLHLCVMLVASIAGSLSAQSPDTELQQLRAEIANLENELNNTSRRLNSELSTLKNLEKQSGLIRQAIRLLQQQIGQTEREIRATEVQIDSLTGQINRLKQHLRNHIVFTYKYQRGKQWDWLLGAKNLNDAMVRYRYTQIIVENGQRLIKRLNEKQAQLLALKEKLADKLSKQKRLAAEKAAEQNALKRKLNERKKLVNEISRSKTLLAAALDEKKESVRRLQRIIAELQRNKTSDAPIVNQPEIDWSRVSGNFAGQRKKLNWPVKGKVSNKFGTYKNPQLKTVLVNNGIDIVAPRGTPVHCVFSGVVSTITYISGFGNVVIVDHNEGYYTVYAHLDDVYVKKFQIVDAGTVLGTVGDTGSLEGVKLHFEIHGNDKPQNPLLWLKN